jgi:hypothetical protein
MDMFVKELHDVDVELPDDPPPASGPEDYGLSADENPQSGEHQAAAPEITSLPPLTLDEWRARDLPDPDFIMGYWLTTTTRALMTAATGLGKTNFGLALGMRVAAGVKFLHWQARRPCRVLYIDGEMSARLLRSRILDEEKRVGATPEHFFALSHEDLKLRPLNTPEGQAWLKAFIRKIGGLDLIVFDNIMCLTLGDQKDPEVWQKTLPLALALTGASIGQIWVHHTGHDESRSYGDKSREWQMDTVAHLDAVKRDDTDVSFTLTFKGKARERTPATRFDFQDVKIALVDDQWEHEATEARRPDKISPRCQKALEALQNVIGSDQAVTTINNRRAAHRDQWQAECTLLGLIDAEAKPHSARTLFATFRRELVAANRIACEGDLSWLL